MSLHLLRNTFVYLEAWFNVMVISRKLLKFTQCIVILNMQFRTSHNQVLILVLLFATVVQTRRVIRAAPGIKTTGQYMVVLTPETSHERFEAIAEIVRTQSLSSKIHKIEGPFAKVVVTKLSVEEAHKVSLKTHTHT